MRRTRKRVGQCKARRARLDADFKMVGIDSRSTTVEWQAHSLALQSPAATVQNVQKMSVQSGLTVAPSEHVQLTVP
jgi:hypothetical protein